MAGTRSKPLSGGKYQGWFTDYTGKRKFFAGVTSRAETERMATRLEDEHRQIRLGYRPAPVSAAKHKARPFAEVVAEYLAWGQSKGGRGGRPWAGKHARNRKAALVWWERRLGPETLGDVDGVLPRAEQALRELQESGRTGKTLNGYMESLGGLCRWCVGQGYLTKDPTKGFVAFDKTVQSKRRAMPPEEIRKLLAACAEHRRLAYEVAFCSGLRANELRSLQVQHLDTRRNGLILDGAWTKNRRDGFQPLPRELVERLEAFAESGEALELYRRCYAQGSGNVKGIPDNPLLYLSAHVGRDMGRDLEAAGIGKWTPEGKLDFHAARVAYINCLIEAGADVKTIQGLARHASVDMTMNVYGRTRPERLSEAAEAVGKMLNFGPEIEEKRALCVHKLAAGAEGLDVNALADKAFDVAAGDGVVGSSPTAATISASERDPDKSRSFRVQTHAESSTCNAGQAGAEDKSATPSQQVQSGVLRPKCVQSVLADSPGEALPHDLRAVVDAWPDLPDAVKAGIVAMIRASAPGQGK